MPLYKKEVNKKTAPELCFCAVYKLKYPRINCELEYRTVQLIGFC